MINTNHTNTYNALKVFMVIPGKQNDTTSMPFARRQADAIEHMGVQVHRFFLASRTSPVALLREYNRFRLEQESFRPDVVHAQFGTMTAFFAMISTRVPLVITFQGSDLNPVPSDKMRSRFAHILSHLASVRAAGIICVSQELAQRLVLPGTNKRAVVIPHSISLETFRLIPRDEARQQLGWSSDEHVVLFNAGRSPQVKRLDLAHAAVEAARSLGYHIRFHVLEGSVDPNKVPLLMNAADCLIVTSDYEGSPNIVKEAMACNLPIVSVDVGDVVERLKDVEPSRIVPRDPYQLGRAIADMLTMGKRSNGREIAARELSNEHIAERIIEVYKQARGI